MLAQPARIVHHVPGRLRIKVEGVRGQTEFFAAVQRAITGLNGVESVHTNATSSSIVVAYEPADTSFHCRMQDDPELGSWLNLDGEEALAAGIDEAVIVGARYLQRHSRLAEVIVSSAEHADANLRKASDGYLDFKVLLPLGMTVVSALHKARNRGTPMWLSVGTFAFNAFLTLHRHRIEAPVVRVLSRRVRRG
jgi:hypothetical protein